jgi:hypothetical protein
MSAVPYLVDLGGVVALMLALMMGVYSLLRSISAPRPKRDDFLAPNTRQSHYAQFAYRNRRRSPSLSRLLAALLFRRA